MLGHILSDPGVLLSSNWVNVEWISSVAIGIFRILSGSVDLFHLL